ncbi:MAG TPA: hypothetical protein V6D29_14250 [Leptolyngbyaceae cyanobacterium]
MKTIFLRSQIGANPMNQIINRLPQHWQQPVHEVVDYALQVKPIEYLSNAFVVPLLGFLMMAFVLLNWKLLAGLLIAFSCLNLLMAAVRVLHKLRSRLGR